MIEFEQIATYKLVPYARNARTHSEAQVAQIAASIKEFGFLAPVVVDKDYGIMAGHGRILAARMLGMETVPCVRADHLTENQKRAYIIADNRLTETSEWDTEMLALEMEDLRLDGYDIDLTGFSADALEALMDVGDSADETEGLTDPDEVPEPPPEPISKTGDIWLLGNHRLMCGDSTDADMVARLMNGEKADMVFTDPPYGIAYSSSKYDGNRAGVTNKRNKAEMIIGDEKSFDPSFLLSAFKGAKEIFVWGYQYYPERLGRGGIIVWNKKAETEANNPHGDFELCWSKNERNKMCWLQWGGFKNKEKGESRLHTTQKPVALALWFFENWGKGLNLVADVFSGSGTTIIAAEKTGRRCYAMELSPAYVDVAVKRFEQFTGKKATNATTGATFG